MPHPEVTFSGIIGHEAHTELLRRTLRSGRVAGAYLLAGVPRLGKAMLAKAFAAALNCERDGDTACGECLTCAKAASGNHPDIRVVQPEGATFKIEQVREITRQIALRPLEGRYKVYILEDVEKMRPEGANALLKTLEEPPGSGVLILLTANVSSLLPTIRSRCQILKFLPVPMETLAEGLMRRDVPEGRARELALLSEGRVGTAIEWSNAPNWRPATDLPAPLNRVPILDAFRVAEQWQKSPEMLDVLLTWYRDMLLLRVGGSTDLLTHREHAGTLRMLARQETVRSLRDKMKAIMQARQRLQRNINASLTMETLAFQLMRLPNGQ